MICLVTDRRRMSAGADNLDPLIDLVAAAARARIDLVQIRERDLDTRALMALVERCLRVVDGTDTKLVLNDRADVAAASHAHGVHLRGDSVAAPSIRSLLGSDVIIGRSVHSAAEAAAVTLAGGLDYLIFGTVYDTSSKGAGHRISTLDELRSACRAAGATPVLAIGGMTIDRAVEAARVGAAGVAGIGLFVPPAGASADSHLQSVAAQLRRAFDTCGAVT
jgi:thiamine-phosphate diphosphorylase